MINKCSLFVGTRCMGCLFALGKLLSFPHKIENENIDDFETIKGSVTSPKYVYIHYSRHLFYDDDGAGSQLTTSGVLKMKL